MEEFFQTAGGLWLPSIAASHGGGLDSDVTAWQTAVGAGNILAAELAAINTMVAGIKSDLGISLLSEKFDRFWVPGFVSNTTAALCDLAARVNLTANNSPTFTNQKGYTGNGSNMSLDTNFVPSTHGVRYTQNNASWMIYIQTMDTRSASFYGQFGAGGGGLTLSFLDKSTGTTQMGWGVNDAANGGVTTTQAQLAGRWSGERTGANAQQLYFNGAQVATDASVASAALGSASFGLLGRKNSGTMSFFTQSTHAVFYVGASLGSTNVAAVDTRIHTCGTAINATNFP